MWLFCWESSAGHSDLHKGFKGLTDSPSACISPSLLSFPTTFPSFTLLQPPGLLALPWTYCVCFQFRAFPGSDFSAWNVLRSHSYLAYSFISFRSLLKSYFLEMSFPNRPIWITTQSLIFSPFHLLIFLCHTYYQVLYHMYIIYLVFCKPHEGWYYFTFLFTAFFFKPQHLIQCQHTVNF